jgi:dTDP-3-amino-3,4,6-trideoxy-alpha-D-glucose transaminase
VVAAPEADELAHRFEQAGIDTRAYYRTPVHRQPAMEPWGVGVDLPGTEQAARENLALPMGPAYGSDVAAAVFEALQA